MLSGSESKESDNRVLDWQATSLFRGQLLSRDPKEKLKRVTWTDLVLNFFKKRQLQSESENSVYSGQVGWNKGFLSSKCFFCVPVCWRARVNGVFVCDFKKAEE